MLPVTKFCFVVVVVVVVVVVSHIKIPIWFKYSYEKGLVIEALSQSPGTRKY